jgi:hypothetical protein
MCEVMVSAGSVLVHAGAPGGLGGELAADVTGGIGQSLKAAW